MTSSIFEIAMITPLYISMFIEEVKVIPLFLPLQETLHIFSHNICLNIDFILWNLFT